MRKKTRQSKGLNVYGICQRDVVCSISFKILSTRSAVCFVNDVMESVLLLKIYSFR